MKKFNLVLAAMAAIVLIGFSSCKEDDDPEPAAPTMTGITMTGDNTAFSAEVTFSQGVYANNDKTGELTNASFTIAVEGGTSELDSYAVTHTAGAAKATIAITLKDIPTGGEAVTIKPASATSIYNEQGKAMSASQEQQASFEGNVIRVVDNGDGTGTTTWTANNVYVLEGFVFVNDGQTLTIEAGTVVKGREGQGENASALVVARGGKLMAEGTADAPIIFTAEADDLNGSVPDLADGLWGGLIILGKAGLNTVPNEQQIEGIPETESRGVYGGTDDTDNSGTLKYISIRHGGTDIGEGNEINGLTLGGVGSGTTIEFIEVIANKDDGVEFFGGTPNLKNIMVAFCGDDSYDYDQGYRGKGQFWAAIQGFDRGDRLGEHDGGTDPETAEPYATPTIFNATYLGRGDGAGKRIITFRDNAGGHYANSIFYGQDKSIDIELLLNECSYTQFENERLTIKNNIFYMAGEPYLSVSAADDVPAATADAADAALTGYFATAMNSVTDPGFTITSSMFNIIPTNAVGDDMAPYTDSFFEAVDYKGAFEPGSNWAEGWTLASKYMTN